LRGILLIKDDEESSPDYNLLKELELSQQEGNTKQINILQSYELSEGLLDSLTWK
jgi:hypothetical protein